MFNVRIASKSVTTCATVGHMAQLYFVARVNTGLGIFRLPYRSISENAIKIFPCIKCP